MSKADHKKKQRSDASGSARTRGASAPGTGRRRSSRKSQTAARKTTGKARKQENTATVDKTSPQPAQSDIPKLDLAKQILAEQRKAAAVKRKGPREQGQVQVEKASGRPAHTAEEPSVPELSEAQQVIAEIVARDIERLCGS